jgi:hypothetical protein
MTRQAMAEITSQQSLQGAGLPGQLRSGPALDTMFEERNKSLLHPATQFLLAKAAVGQQLLELARANYTPERVIHYVGKDKKFRVLRFFMADIRSDLHCIIDRSTMLPSPSAERAKMLEALQAGAFDPANNEDDKIEVFKILEFGTVQDMITDRLQEEENQDREIEEMIQDAEGWARPRADSMATEPGPDGGPQTVQGYPTNPYDDDEAHVRVLLRYIRSEEFRDLEPRYQQPILLLHLQEHQGKIQQAEQDQLEMEMALKGTQGEKGRPSAPKVASA